MIDEILILIAALIFSSIFFYTGEFILYILSIGRKKPRWDFYLVKSNIRASSIVILWGLSGILGFFFWLFVLALINNP